MPGSRSNLKKEQLGHISLYFPRDTRVIDIGAGNGDGGKALRGAGFTKIDAVEIWGPWISKFELRRIYRTVIHANVMDIKSFPSWELAILGDVLEHLEVSDAQLLLSRLEPLTSYIMVPWKSEQGPLHGNQYETHIQADLTPTVMMERYPTLQALHMDKRKGLFIQEPR